MEILVLHGQIPTLQTASHSGTLKAYLNALQFEGCEAYLNDSQLEGCEFDAW